MTTPWPPKKVEGTEFAKMQELKEKINEWSGRLADTLTENFEALLAKLAESVGKQLTALNVRTSELEAALPRFASGGGCAGPIKSTKPYDRPVSSDRARMNSENTPGKHYGTE